MSRMTQGTRARMAVVACLTAVTVGYSAVAYVDVARVAGVGYYDMNIELADGQGLYPGSLVTLSGVEVGEITELETGPEGVVVSVIVDDEVEIPKSSRVEVRSISAAGEQYLDLAAPASGTGQRTADQSSYREGDTIPASAGRSSITTAELLHRVDDLVTSIPVSDLRTTVDEVGEGLTDGARDLNKFLDAILPLQEEFTRNLDPTQDLVTQAEGVLGTQVSTERELSRATAELARFTRQLKASDKDLRGSLTDVPQVTEQVRRLVQDLEPTMPVLLGSMSQVGEVTATYDPAVRHILTVVPGLVNGFQTALNSSPVDGAVSLFARSVVNDPPPCTSGFVQERRSPREIAPLEPPTSVYCRVAPNSEQAVRGARHYPCPNVTRRGPSALTPCGLFFQAPDEVADVQRQALDRQIESAQHYLLPGAQQGTPYDPLTNVLGTSGSPLALLDSGRPIRGDGSWNSLLLGPLGLG